MWSGPNPGSYLGWISHSFSHLSIHYSTHHFFMWLLWCAFLLVCFSSFHGAMTVHTFWASWSLSLSEEAFKEYTQQDHSFSGNNKMAASSAGLKSCGQLLKPWQAWRILVWGMPHHVTPCFALNILESVSWAMGKGETGPCCPGKGNLLWYIGQHVLYLIWKPYTLKISRKHPKEGSN